MVISAKLLVTLTYHAEEIGFLIWTTSCLEFRSLDLGPAHFLGQKGLSTKEKLMIVPPTIGSSRQSAEAVQI